jgi:hypothetical protein
LVITQEALRILHGKLSFLGNVSRQYDNRFANEGAKIGSLLNIRMPAKYTVRTGASASFQDHVERSTPLTITTQVGVDVSFTTFDLTLSLDDISNRILTPAMSQLAAFIENDCLTAAKNLTYQYNGTTTTSGQMTFAQMDETGAILTRQLAPYGNRVALLDPTSRNNFNVDVKGLFQSSDNIREQYREGMMGRTSGYDVYESTFLPTHTTGTFAGSPLTTTGTTAIGSSTTSNAWVSGTTVWIDGATALTTLTAGDIITISGLYDVHPETKVTTGILKRFVVQANITLTTATSSYGVSVRPGIMFGSGNAYRNVLLSGPANMDNNTVTLIGNVGTTYGQNLMFAKDAFVFATADLIDVSQYGAWGARAVQDGISMRIGRQWALSTDTVPTRIDIAYGFADLYAENAVRHWHT